MAEEVGLKSLFAGLDFQVCCRVFEAEEERACVFKILVVVSFNSLKECAVLSGRSYSCSFGSLIA